MGPNAATFLRVVAAQKKSGGIERKAIDKPVKKAKGVEAVNEPTTGERLAATIGTLQITGKLRKNLKEVEKKTRPKP
jgi:hypothetical protein